MKSGMVKRGFTLIEMIITVAVIVILVSMVIGVTRRIDDQSRERLCRAELALIDSALVQFRDFGFEYKGSYYGGHGLNFPIDCNVFSRVDLEIAFQSALGYVAAELSILTVDPDQIDNSGSEALYLILNQIPDCRTTIDKIDKSLISNKDRGGNELKIRIIGIDHPLLRFIDPWKMPLKYDYYPDFADYTGSDYLKDRDSAKRTFPVITSAGVDKKFGTDDDIVNRQGK